MEKKPGSKQKTERNLPAATHPANLSTKPRPEIRVDPNSKEEILKRSSDEVIAMAIRDVLIKEREKRAAQKER